MFDRVGAGYDARPGYPDALFDVLVERCGLGDGCQVLEIGPGSGQATMPMLDRGAQITAVESGPTLAELLVERTSGRPIDVVVSPFETVELPEVGFDLVAAATAFHWIETTTGLERCGRFLRDRGWLALWWTIWGDPDRADPFHDALVPVLQVKAPHLLDADATARSYINDVSARAAQIDETGAFGAVQEDTWLWNGAHDPAALRAMFATFSAWIALPEPLHTELLDDVERIARDEFGGTVARPYRTVLYTAPRRA